MKFFLILIIFSSSVAHSINLKGEWQTLLYRPIHYSQDKWNDLTAYHNLLFSLKFEKPLFEILPPSLEFSFGVSYSHPLKRVSVPQIYGWRPVQIGVKYPWSSSYQIFAHGVSSYLKDFDTAPLLFGLEVGGRKTFIYKKFYWDWSHFISLNAPRYLLRSFLGSYFHNNLLSLGTVVDGYTPTYKGFQLHSRWGFYAFYTYSRSVYYTWDSEWILSYSMKRWSFFASWIHSFNSREFLNTQNFNPYDKALHIGVKIKFL